MKVIAVIDLPPLLPDQIAYIKKIQEWEKRSRREFKLRLRTRDKPDRLK